MATLAVNTVLTNPETDQPVVLLVGETVPDWAKDLVGDHLLEPEGDKPAKGDKKETWIAYADKIGIAVEADATKDAIIAAVEAAESE